MNLNFESVYRDYRRLPPSRKAAECRQAIRSLYAHKDALGLSNEEVEELILCTVELFLRADRVISKGETDLLSLVFEGGKLEQKVLASLKDDIVPVEAEWDRIIDRLNADAKDAVTLLGMNIIAADGEITARERILFQKIYA